MGGCPVFISVSRTLHTQFVRNDMVAKRNNKKQQPKPKRTDPNCTNHLSLTEEIFNLEASLIKLLKKFFFSTSVRKSVVLTTVLRTVQPLTEDHPKMKKKRALFAEELTYKEM